MIIFLAECVHSSLLCLFSFFKYIVPVRHKNGNQYKRDDVQHCRIQILHRLRHNAQTFELTKCVIFYIFLSFCSLFVVFFLNAPGLYEIEGEEGQEYPCRHKPVGLALEQENDENCDHENQIVNMVVLIAEFGHLIVLPRQNTIGIIEGPSQQCKY